MCIIIGGLKKNLKREEQMEGMRMNSSGFYVAVLRNATGLASSSRRYVFKEIRTLDATEAMKVWDEAKDDDYVVTHSRIPSHGSTSLDNVHGWESDGIRFMHNGTMTNVADLMDKSDSRTDSEYFFREIFIPLWRSQGRNFNKLVSNVVNAVRGSSRLCFIMQDGSVMYFGDYEKDHDCMFSNKSYKVFPNHGSFGYGGYNWGRPAGSGSIGFGSSAAVGSGTGVVAGGLVTKPDSDWDPGKVFTASVGGAAGVAKIAISHVVLESLTSKLISEVSMDGGSGGVSAMDDFEQNLPCLYPSFMAADDPRIQVDPISTLSMFLNGAKLDRGELESMLDIYAHDVAGYVVLEEGMTEAEVLEAFKEDVARINMTMRMCNASFDWTSKKLKTAVRAWKMTVNRKHQAKMVERDPTEVFDILKPGKRTKQDWIALGDNLALLYEEIRKGKPAW